MQPSCEPSVPMGRLAGCGGIQGQSLLGGPGQRWPDAKQSVAQGYLRCSLTNKQGEREIV